MPNRAKQSTSPSHLNLILGDSAGGTFNATFGSNATLLIDRDVLSCGPTPRRHDLDAWRQMRRKFWASLVPGMFEDEDASRDALLEGASKLAEAERITIWAAMGLTEQLFIASACNLIATANVSLDRVELVQFEHLPKGQKRVIGVGQLNEEQMRNHPAATPIEADAFVSYLALWDALTSPDPRVIESFAEQNASASTWSKDAMRLMLRRFPDVSTGLPHWDFRVLANVHAHGPDAVQVISHTMVENWDDADLVGDYYLFGRLLRMAKTLTMPLLKLTGDTSNMRATQVELTPFGLDVLEGRASNFPTNPIEDWAAGVQLSSISGLLWFRDGDRLVAANPNPNTAP